MASAAALSLAPGNAGWTMPRLGDGVSTAHQVWRGDRVAALIGSGLLRAGVAGADTWALAEQDSFQFARLSIKHFVDHEPFGDYLCRQLWVNRIGEAKVWCKRKPWV